MKPFDPRSWLIILILAFAVSILSVGWIPLSLLACVSVMILFLFKKKQTAGKFFVIYAICSLAFFGLPFVQTSAFGVMLYSAIKMLPVLMIGMLFIGTSPSAMLYVGQRMHVPKSILLMICILLRFFPIVFGEIHAIWEGIRARNIFPHWYDAIIHPAIAYECFVLPLIVRALKLSSELSCAAEVRGVEADAQRTTIRAVGIHSRDIALISIYTVAMFGIIVFGRVAL